MTASIRLAIDSATDRLSIAADTGPGSAAVELGVVGARRHAASLLPLIDQALNRLDGRIDDLALVAVSDGPGSFTGLRVGISVAKALALSARIPLISTPSLLVRAAGAARPGERMLALSSALRGEVFAGAWWFDHAVGVVELFPPRAIGWPHLDALPPVDRIIGEGPPDLIAALCARAGLHPVSVAEGWPSAMVLLRLAGMDGGTRVVTDPASWEPTYGRPAEAQAKWEREHGRPLPDSGVDPG